LRGSVVPAPSRPIALGCNRVPVRFVIVDFLLSRPFKARAAFAAERRRCGARKRSDDDAHIQSTPLIIDDELQRTVTIMQQALSLRKLEFAVCGSTERFA
jgi:hypothetical protein